MVVRCLEREGWYLVIGSIRTYTQGVLWRLLKTPVACDLYILPNGQIDPFPCWLPVDVGTITSDRNCHLCHPHCTGPKCYNTVRCNQGSRLLNVEERQLK